MVMTITPKSLVRVAAGAMAAHRFQPHNAAKTLLVVETVLALDIRGTTTSTRKQLLHHMFHQEDMRHAKKAKTVQTVQTTITPLRSTTFTIPIDAL
jgi:hypothetical protein